MLPVETSYKIYTGRDGKPLDRGYVYFGQPNQNPITAPVEVYWDADGTQKAAQPLRTESGYIMRAGTPANVFFDGAYSELVLDSKKRQVFNSRSSDAFSIGTMVQNLFSSIASSVGSSLVGFIQSGTDAVMRTMQVKMRETVSITDFAGIVADGTDQTAKIVDFFASLDVSYTGIFVFPYNVKFNATTVYAAIPPRVLIQDNSVINTANPSGYFPRVTGLVTNCDTANTDSTFLVSDSHNANIVVENRGTAPTTSALNRVVAFLWGVGRFLRGQPGIRSLGRWEFANIFGLDKWSWVIRRYLPWAARNAEYWTPSTAIAAGEYIISDPERIYMTVAGGTTGLVAPTHTSGTAVDGTVTWTFVSGQTDSVCFGVNENGELATNAAPAQSVVAYLRSNPDSGGSAVLIVEATAINKRSELRLRPTDAAGVAITALPSFSAVEDATLRLRSSTLLRDLFVASDAGGLRLGTYGHTEATAANLSTTPSVQNCALLKIFNSAPTSITDFLNSTVDQEVTLFFQNGNTTLVHNASVLYLKGLINVTPAANQMIVIKKYTGSLVWFEKSRSF